MLGGGMGGFAQAGVNRGGRQGFVQEPNGPSRWRRAQPRPAGAHSGYIRQLAGPSLGSCATAAPALRRSGRLHAEGFRRTEAPARGNDITGGEWISGGYTRGREFHAAGGWVGGTGPAAQSCCGSHPPRQHPSNPGRKNKTKKQKKQSKTKNKKTKKHDTKNKKIETKKATRPAARQPPTEPAEDETDKGQTDRRQWCGVSPAFHRPLC